MRCSGLTANNVYLRENFFMQINKHKVVGINYVLKDDAGVILDQSKDGQPLYYIQGIGNLIPGLEEELEGKAAGDVLNVSIAPEKAYGIKNEELIQQVPLEAFGGQEVKPGMQFTANNGDNQYNVVVTAVSDSNVTVDANHPLAGATLHFDVEVKDVREATSDELDHGHVHGPGGHAH